MSEHPPMCHCLACRPAGPVLKYEVNFGEEEFVRAKADWKLDTKEARLELQPKISEQ